VKRLVSIGILACSLITTLAEGQDMASDSKHLTVVPLTAHRPVVLTANTIERGISYPSVVILKGDVEIKTPVCLPVGKKGKMICDGEMIVRADEAEFHEDTGKVEAHGNVAVTPLRHEPKKPKK